MDTLSLKVFTDILGMITSMSLSAFPLFFSIAFPVFYVILKKLFNPKVLIELQEKIDHLVKKSDKSNEELQELKELKGLKNEKCKQRIIAFFSIPDLDNKIIYTSLFLFVVGAIVLKVDQNNIENTRKNGLRIKEYMVQNNQYIISIDSLKNKIIGNTFFCTDKIDYDMIKKILKNYPNDFIEVGTNIILVEPILEANSTANKLPSEQQKIYTFSVKLLERYLSNDKIKTDSSITFETLQKINKRFTQEIIYKLITDDPIKYYYAKDSNNNELIIIKK